MANQAPPPAGRQKPQPATGKRRAADSPEGATRSRDVRKQRNDKGEYVAATRHIAIEEFIKRKENGAATQGKTFPQQGFALFSLVPQQHQQYGQTEMQTRPGTEKLLHKAHNDVGWIEIPEPGGIKRSGIPQPDRDGGQRQHQRGKDLQISHARLAGGAEKRPCQDDED
jgi:hypothetical protein